MSKTDKQSEFEYNSIDYGSKAESLTDSKKLTKVAQYQLETKT